MCKSDNEGPMAIQIAPLVGAGLGALQQSKIEKALAGEKTYTKPKSLVILERQYIKYLRTISMEISA